MIAGMYVRHRGTRCQVARITSTATLGPHGMPTPAVEYALAPEDGSAWRYITDPTASELQPCTEPARPAQPTVLPVVEVSPWARSAQHGELCGCRMDHCVECARLPL